MVAERRRERRRRLGRSRTVWGVQRLVESELARPNSSREYSSSREARDSYSQITRVLSFVAGLFFWLRLFRSVTHSTFTSGHILPILCKTPHNRPSRPLQPHPQKNLTHTPIQRIQSNNNQRHPHPNHNRTQGRLSKCHGGRDSTYRTVGEGTRKHCLGTRDAEDDGRDGGGCDGCAKKGTIA